MNGGKLMKRKLSFLLAFITLISIMLSSGFTIPVSAADDSFSWAFWGSQPAPISENIAADTQNITGQVLSTYTALTATLNSGPAGNSNEPASNVLVDNQSTKWCYNTAAPGADLNFILDLGANYASLARPMAYAIRGANDDTGYSGRCLSAFTLSGSNSATGTWTTLSTQTGVSWGNANYYLNIFNISPTQNYRYYRLNITARCNANGGSPVTTSGTMQFSYFGMITSFTQGGTANYLIPQIAAAPGAMLDGDNTPWNGENVLIVNGTTGGTGTGTISAKSYTTIRKDLNIAVYPDTKLSYCINPQYGSSYDYKLTSAHSAIDLLFDDGTRLKDLGAKDYFGFPMTPLGQGQARVSHMGSWNFVESNIGEVAAGKTIVAIIAGFEMPTAPRNIAVRAAFDDIKIFRRDDHVLIPATELADFADVRFGTRVGTYGNGSCSPLVGTPNAFNYWVPCTGTGTGSPYNSQSRNFQYIRISHIASRWFSEVGTMVIKADAASNTANTNAMGTFHKDNEFATTPYHYGVKVDTGVSIEVTPMEHSAVFRFTFPAGSTYRNIMFGSTGATPVITGNTFTTQGTGTSYGVRNMLVYGEFSQTPSSSSLASGTSRISFNANTLGPNGETVIEMKIATSFMSAAQAKKNLDLEIDPTDNFNSVMAKSKAIWNKVFSATAIDDPTASYWDLVDFYSKFARTCMYPTTMHENTQTGTIAEAKANPRWQYVSPYRGSTSSIVIRDGYFSYNEGFWDTFRSKWTALIFLRPSDAGRLFDGVVSHFTDQDTRGSFGIPRWIKPAGQNLMVMTSSDVIATELYARGVDYNYKVGYDASLKSSTVYGPTSGTEGGRFGIQQSIFYGYTPWGAAPAAGGGGQLDTSWALEGFVNDAGTAKMAAGLRDEALAAGNADLARTYNDEHIYFTNRAKYYTNHFNPTNTGSVNSPGWMMNKNTSGQWLGGNGSTSTAFNALDWGWGFCEDNAYNYVVSVTQDGRGLANLFGGKKAFGDKMTHIFADSSWDGVGIRGGGYGGAIHEAYEKREVKIGQWGLSNEPGEHMQSMWLFTDRPEQAFKYTRMGMQQAGGSIQVGRGMMGEEDNGSMASWWVWAYIGLYPLDQGSGNVVVGSPRFKKVDFNLDDGRTFTFLAPNAGPQNCYVNGIKFNGVPYNKLYFTQDMFQDGNIFEFDMSDTPNNWAKNAEQPPSLTETGDGPGFGPDILMDIIPVGVTCNTAMPAPTSTTRQAIVDGITTANAAYLFDNSSVTTEAVFTGTTATVTYYSPTPVRVELYTLTSSNTSGADPKAWVLEASNTGAAGSWVELDSRNLPNLTTYNNAAVTTAANAGTKTSETFRWRRQTKPFAIDPAKQGVYQFYRLRITQASSTVALRLSQFELLADQFYTVTKDALLAALNNAKAIIPIQEAGPVYGAAEYAEMLTILVASQAVYDNADAIGREINNATNTLNAAVAALIRIQKAWDRFLAIDESANNDRVVISGAARKDPTASTPATTNGVAGVTLLSTLPITGTTSFYPLANTVPGSGAAYKYIDFGDGDRLFTQVSAVYCGNQNSTNGGRVYVRLDAPDGDIIATIDARPTATTTNWSRYAYGYGNLSTPNITGVHTVYFEFDNNNAEYAGNFHSFQFEYVQPAPYATVVRDRSEATAPPYAAISPVVDFLNGSGANIDLKVITATYNASGKMISMVETPVTSAANTRLQISPASVTTAAGNTVKLFVWRAEDYVPIIPARDLN